MATINTGINRWKIGPVDSFGAGITEDDSGNKIYDLLERKYNYEQGEYGRVRIYSSEEDAFQSQVQNQDSDGYPDYANNYLSSEFFTMKIYIKNEVVHSAITNGDLSPSSFTTEC